MITREFQVDFPEVDLSERNTDFLRGFLLQANLTHTISPENSDGHLEDFFTQFDLISKDSALDVERDLHSAARNVVFEAAIKPMTSDHYQLTYGYTLQGIFTEIISPKELLAHSVPLAVALKSLTRSARKQSLPEFLDATKKDFLHTQKNTAHLIGETASKLLLSSPEDAILGASIRRRIELDSRDYLKQIS